MNDRPFLVETGTGDHGRALSHTQNTLLQLTPWEMDGNFKEHSEFDWTELYHQVPGSPKFLQKQAMLSRKRFRIPKASVLEASAHSLSTHHDGLQDVHVITQHSLRCV